MRKHLSEMSLEEQTRLARLTFKNRYEGFCRREDKWSLEY